VGDAQKFGHRQFEDAEAVDLPDAQVDREGGGRDEPAIITGGGHGVFTIKNVKHSHYAFWMMDGGFEIFTWRKRQVRNRAGRISRGFSNGNGSGKAAREFP
jgi:hypothetical protein